jgi:hypothetical protein
MAKAEAEDRDSTGVGRIVFEMIFPSVITLGSRGRMIMREKAMESRIMSMMLRLAWRADEAPVMEELPIEGGMGVVGTRGLCLLMAGMGRGGRRRGFRGWCIL